MSKKFVCIFIFFILLIFLPCFIFAVDKQDIYNYVNFTSQDDNSSKIDYRVYNKGGLHEGSFTIPADINQKASIISFITDNGTVYILTTDNNQGRYFQSLTNNNTQYYFYGGEFIRSIGFKYKTYKLNEDGSFSSVSSWRNLSFT